MTQMPVGDPTPPTVRKELNALWKSIRALGTPVDNDVDTTAYKEHEVIFSRPGVNANDQSPAYHVRWSDAYIAKAYISYGQSLVSSNDEVVLLWVNDDNVAGFTQDNTGTGSPDNWYGIGSDDYLLTKSSGDVIGWVVEDMMIPIELFDLIYISTTGGAGGTDLTVQLVVMVPRDGE